MRYLIQTSGKGMLPAGVTVGHIEADSPDEAEESLILKRDEKGKLRGQIPEKFRGHFNFVPA